jgi:hypothetical protein
MLGHALPVTTPEGNMGPAKAALVLPFVDPITALRHITLQVAETQRSMDPRSPYVQFGQVLEAAPLPSAMNGQAALILYELGLNSVPYRAISLVDVAVTGPVTWLYYTSGMSAPASTFEQVSPTMWEVWKSWSVNPQVLHQRILQATRSMRKTHELLTGATAYRKQVFERAHTAWVEYIRGRTIIDNAKRNTYKEIPNHMVKKYLEEQNREAGYQKYRAIPLADLN